MGSLRCVFIGVLVLTVPGCARSAEERQLDEMREALTKVDEHPDFGEALTTKELAEAVRDNQQRQRPPSTPRHVLHFEDGSEEDSEASPEAAGFEAADDPSRRPTIKVEGIKARGAREVVEQTMPDESSETPATTSAGTNRPSALDAEAARAYDAALALVNGKQYTQGLDAFAAFLLRYPDHPYAPNAMYWRAECYFAQGEYVRAVEQFEGVLARFPMSSKVPDALLKLGISQQKLGNPSKAQTYFDKLTREWPRSDAARRIPTARRAGDNP